MKKHSSHIPENLQLNSVLLLVLLLALISGSAGLLLYAVLCPEARPEGLPLFPILFLLCAFDILVIFVYIFMVYLPVRRLTQALAQVMEGNFDDLLEETGAGDLSAASRNFNRFLISVRQMIHNEYNIKLLKKHAELNALQSQINPHFLYNTIDSIRGQALLDGSYDIAGIAKALASIFRYCIDTPSNMVTVREEMPAPDFCVTTTGGTAGSNFNTQNYTKWSKPVKSCLFVDEDGYLTRAEFINGRLIRDIQHGRDLKRQRQYPGRTSTDGRVLCVRFLPVYCLREDEQQGNNASGTCHHWRKNVQSIRHWQSGF